jgi:hypothetical protein
MMFLSAADAPIDGPTHASKCSSLGLSELRDEVLLTFIRCKMYWSQNLVPARFY